VSFTSTHAPAARRLFAVIAVSAAALGAWGYLALTPPEASRAAGRKDRPSPVADAAVDVPRPARVEPWTAGSAWDSRDDEAADAITMAYPQSPMRSQFHHAASHPPLRAAQPAARTAQQTARAAMAERSRAAVLAPSRPGGGALVARPPTGQQKEKLQAKQAKPKAKEQRKKAGKETPRPAGNAAAASPAGPPSLAAMDEPMAGDSVTAASEANGYELRLFDSSNYDNKPGGAGVALPGFERIFEAPSFWARNAQRPDDSRLRRIGLWNDLPEHRVPERLDPDHVTALAKAARRYGGPVMLDIEHWDVHLPHGNQQFLDTMAILRRHGFADLRVGTYGLWIGAASPEAVEASDWLVVRAYYKTEQATFSHWTQWLNRQLDDAMQADKPIGVVVSPRNFGVGQDPSRRDELHDMDTWRAMLDQFLLLRARIEAHDVPMWLILWSSPRADYAREQPYIDALLEAFSPYVTPRPIADPARWGD